MFIILSKQLVSKTNEITYELKKFLKYFMMSLDIVALEECRKRLLEQREYTYENKDRDDK